jgi:hypothetical protein
MIILDTNVVSLPSKPIRDERAMAWLNRQDPSTVFVTTVSLAEISVGVATLPEGRRKDTLRSVMDAVLAGFVTPLLPFDRAAAISYAEIVVHAKAKKYTLAVADGFIAAIAKAHGFAVATRDADPFRAAGVAVINPWED